MRVHGQIAVSLAVAIVGIGLWGFFAPQAKTVLAGIGLADKAASPRPGNTGQAGQGGAALAGAGQTGEGQTGGASRPANAPLVVTAAVGRGTVNDRMSAIGSGEAIQSVMVMPQAAGTVREILISSGDKVSKGQVIAKLDDEEQKIARDQAAVALKSAQEKSALYSNLKASVSRMEAFDAGIAEENAKLQLETASLNLKRRDIVAPISGIAGIVAVNVGDNVTTQTQVVAIDDRSEILVNFWAPERFTNAIKLDMPVEATAIARPGKTFSGVVEAVDNRLDSASRTTRIRARIDNSDDQLRAGMSFSVSMRFQGESFPTVDPLSVQWDARGSYVWCVKDGRSQKVRVAVVQRNPDAVLVRADLTPGDLVATEGLLRLRDGGPVRSAQETAALRQETER